MISFPSVALSAVLAAFALAAVMAPVGPPSRDAYRVPHSTAGADTLRTGDDSVWTAPEVRWGTDPWPTSFRALATTDGLWLRFDAVDGSPWYTYTARDDRLWEEEVVEIFIDPDGDHRNYLEVEVNPANAVCDLLVRTASPELRADLGWDFPGLDSAVVPLHEDGAVVGWRAVVLLPWDGFAQLPATAVALPPTAGDRWRFNVFRIKRPGGPERPDAGVVLDAWSPVPGASFHVPEVFRVMEFE